MLNDTINPGLRLTRKIFLHETILTEIVIKNTGLFNPEFVGPKNLWLTAKCNLIQDQNKIKENKYRCPGVSKKYNDLLFEHYKDALDVFQKTAVVSK